VVSFTTRPLYHQGKSPWHPLDRRLGGPQSRILYRYEPKFNFLYSLWLVAWGARAAQSMQWPGYGLDERGSIPVRGSNFLIATASEPVMGPTQPPVQWVPAALSLGHEADRSPPSSAEVNNVWRYTSTPAYVFMSWCLVKRRENFIFSVNSQHQLTSKSATSGPKDGRTDMTFPVSFHFMHFLLSTREVAQVTDGANRGVVPKGMMEGPRPTDWPVWKRQL
jgi:hypothetical protein